MTTPAERRIQRSEWMYVGIFVAVASVVYAVVGVMRVAGII